MDAMTTQNNLADFLKNPESAQELNGLVEDICYTLMDYQVFTLKKIILIVSNIHLRLHYNKTSLTKMSRL